MLVSSDDLVKNEIEKTEEYYISCDLRGGLGNQLFLVACVYALSFEHNLTPVFKKIDSSPSIFKNRSVYFDTILKKINVISDDEYNKINFVKLDEGSQNYKKIQLEKNKSYMLHGYFQSPKYFKKYMSQITELLELDSLAEIRNYYDNVKKDHKTTVSVHVRRGDYLALSHFHTVLSVDYYDSAMKYFDKSALFIVFSDDIEWCKNNLNIPNVYFIENIQSRIPSDLFELFLMSMCDNNIIANSSFSAWAAYLNKNENKKVIAPRKWFVPPVSNDQISDIYDDDWIIIYGYDVLRTS